jgi:hypothetical protein
LYANLDPSNGNFGLTEENKGKFQEMRIKLKFQKSVSVIKEEQDEEMSDEESEEEEVEETLKEDNNDKEESKQSFS